MAWRSLQFSTSAEQSEALSDALMDCGALSASIEDAYQNTLTETPVFGEPGAETQALWPTCRVNALFADDTDLLPIIHQLSAAIDFPLPAFHIDSVAEQDWVRVSQAEFAPIEITSGLWIVPSWHLAPNPAAICIQLDPGLAFGTGSHPTTRLCLEWLAAQPPTASTRVLDYGCGSGILAIAACKLGAGLVIGIDIDPIAIDTAVANAKNNLCPKIHFALPDQDKEATYDLVIANILTNPLRTLAPLLASRCHVGSTLLLSGILDQQVSLIQQAYQDWFDLEIASTQEGWACLTGVRRS